MKQDTEFSRALASNLRLKSLVLACIFSAILILQATVILCVDVDGKSVVDILPTRVLFLGPVIMLVGLFSEITAMRYFKKLSVSDRIISPLIMYSITLVETCFPFFVILFAWSFFPADFLTSPSFLLHSPPALMFFIMIILSAFMLDQRVSIFSGVIAGICMIILVKILQPNETALEQFETKLGLLKSVFLVLAGIVAGFLAQRTRKAVVTSLQAKNELIVNLDKLVGEKTAEIKQQNALLEAKHKDITDSILYAQKIQRSLLPTEVYIDRILKDLRK